MARGYFKKFIPDAEKFSKLPATRNLRSWLGSRLSDPALWHLNRKTFAGGVAVGIFFGWMPLPMQMLMAAVAAMYLHVNLPVSVALVWISNPVTFPAFLYASYRAGVILTDRRLAASSWEPSIHWIVEQMHVLWKPILAGSLFLGAVSAVVAYLAMRILWRLLTIRRWTERRTRVNLLKR